MDKLKQFIEDNRDAFDDDIQLPEGHFERFEQKLPSPRKRPVWLYTVTIAAAACLAMLFLLKPPANPLGEEEQYVCEIEDVQLFYQMQMNDVLAQMETLSETDQSQGVALLLEASRKILTDNEQFEQQILPELPCSPEGLFAMNQHYNTSIASLNVMLEQMEKVIDIDNNTQ